MKLSLALTALVNSLLVSAQQPGVFTQNDGNPTMSEPFPSHTCAAPSQSHGHRAASIVRHHSFTKGRAPVHNAAQSLACTAKPRKLKAKAKTTLNGQQDCENLIRSSIRMLRVRQET